MAYKTPRKMREILIIKILLKKSIYAKLRTEI